MQLYLNSGMMVGLAEPKLSTLKAAVCVLRICSLHFSGSGAYQGQTQSQILNYNALLPFIPVITSRISTRRPLLLSVYRLVLIVCF